MDRANHTQTSLAEAIGSTQSTVHSYLIGRSKPSLAELEVWANALNLSIQERDSFKWVAMEPYTPPEIWAKVSALMSIITDHETHVGHLQVEIAHLRAKIARFESERIRTTEQL
jgi:transcriptional regulator with XRE-family HTH domain